MLRKWTEEQWASRQVENRELMDLLTLSCTEGVAITRDRYNNITLSKQPESAGGVYKVGIDEAGRGPLAGPMVYGLVYWKEDPETKVYDDSKKVKKPKRIEQHRELFMRKDVGFIITLLSPLFISINMLCKKKDSAEWARASMEKSMNTKTKKRMKMCSKNALEAMDRKKGIAQFMVKNADGKGGIEIPGNIVPAYHEPMFISKHRLNLSELSISCIVQMIKACSRMGVEIQEIYIDTVGPKTSLAKIIRENTEHCKMLKKIVVEEKADGTYQVVGAASILAKVTRDLFIEKGDVWRILYGEIEHSPDVGSGYPSDPTTRKWMDISFVLGLGFLPVIRISWKPVLDAMKSRLSLKQEERSSIGKLMCYLPRERHP